MTATEERLQEQQPPEEELLIEAEWVPVTRWDEAAGFITDPDNKPSAVIRDIEDIQRVQARMRGGPQLEPEFARATEILDGALKGRRLELARIIIRLHGGDAETVGTGS